jgi:hypothetical protein
MKCRYVNGLLEILMVSFAMLAALEIVWKTLSMIEQTTREVSFVPFPTDLNRNKQSDV